MSSSFRTTAMFITIVAILATSVKGECTIQVPIDSDKPNDAGFCSKQFVSIISATDCKEPATIKCVPAVESGTAYTYPVGITPVTCTATDADGNTSPSDMYTVTVNDVEPPNPKCQQNINVGLNANGNGQITANDINNGSSDNCAIASLSIDKDSFTCDNVGSNTITLTVTDVHGNNFPCESTVTVEDSIDPVAICQNITAQLDDTGNVQITANDIDNGSNDACGIASRVIDKSSFICDNVGDNIITLTVTDVNGNKNTCQSIVTVAWNVICPSQPPTMTTNDPTQTPTSPTEVPTNNPTQTPTNNPTQTPTIPTNNPTKNTKNPTKDQSDSNSQSDSQSDEMNFNMNALFEQSEKDHLHVNFDSTQDTASDNTKLSVLGLFFCIVMAIHLCYLCQKGFNKQQKVDSDSLQEIKISK